MKVLVLTHFDADNLRILNVLKELKKRKHQLGLYCRFLDEQNIRMFAELNEKLHNLSELNSKIADQYDVIFTSLHGQSWVKYYNKYVFFFNHYFDNHWLTQGADFMFISCTTRKLSYHEDCATMPVGDPKNDTIKKSALSENRILYIDTGHYPFGRKGKEQVADMLLEIAYQFPNYEICIKPRWLPRQNSNTTHRNSMHLYDIINERCSGRDFPPNLNMLKIHKDMQELLDSSISVVTTCSSAYLDVVLREKNIVIVEGFDSDDKFDFRNDAEIKDSFNQKRSSGCVVHYKDVIKYLPYGIKCSDAHIDTIMAYRNGASKRIVDTMEYVYTNFLRYGKFPEKKEYFYETYQHEMKEDKLLSFSSLQYERVKNCMLELFNIRFMITAPIDFTSVYDFLITNYRNYELNNEGYGQLLKDTIRNINNLIIQNRCLLMNDPIDQSRLLQALYETDNITDIVNFPNNKLLCPNVHNYYMGAIYKDQQSSVAINHFVNFLSEANSRPYSKYSQENNVGISSAYTYIFDKYDCYNLQPSIFADLYIYFYKERDITIVNFQSRKRAHNYLPKTAEQLKQTDITTAMECMMLYAQYEYHYNTNEKESALKAALQDNNRVLTSISYRLGRTITFLPRKTRKIVKSIRREGIKKTGHIVKEDIKRLIDAKLPNLFYIWKIFHTKIMIGYQLYSNFIDKYGSNAYLFLTGAATGDTYIYSMLFEAFSKKEYPNSNNVIGVFGNSGIDIANLFRINQAEAYGLDEFRYLWNLSMFTRPEYVHIKCMHYHVIYRHIAILMHLEGLHGFNLLSLSEAFLGIEDNAIINPPIFDNDKNILKDLFKENNLTPGKTVLIAPYAKSVRQIPILFWKKLADKLSEQGYKVCTNSIGIQEPPIEGTIAMQIPHSVSVPFLEMAGITIGLRSGFQDITNTANCLKITLYPTNNFDRSIACDINQSYSLIDMYSQKNQYDLFYSIETEDTILQNIMNITNGFSGASAYETR